MDMYRELILDHYRHPRNFGHLDHVDAAAQAYNATCGDKLRIELRIKNKELRKKIIEDVRFFGEGCVISQASASMLTEKVKGMSATQIQKLSLQDIQKMIGTTLTPSRVKCAALPLEVLQKAVLSI